MTRFLPVRAARLLCATLAIILLPAASGAACDGGSPCAFLSFRTNPDGGCFVVVNQEYQFVDVTIRTVPAQKIRFSLPTPPFGTVLGTGWDYPHTGDLATGIELTPPSCIEGEAVHLGLLYVQVPGGSIDACTAWTFENAEIVTCDGKTRPALGTTQTFGDPTDRCDQCDMPGCPCSDLVCETLPSFGLSPPDGATGVDPAVELSWMRPSWESVPASSVICLLGITTSPDCSTFDGFVISDGDKTSFTPESLEPATTYYWRVLWLATDANCGSGEGGVTAWSSFTTAEPISVEHATWGYVKSMYR